jgi:hypothetical protein
VAGADMWREDGRTRFLMLASLREVDGSPLPPLPLPLPLPLLPLPLPLPLLPPLPPLLLLYVLLFGWEREIIFGSKPKILRDGDRDGGDELAGLTPILFAYTLVVLTALELL